MNDDQEKTNKSHRPAGTGTGAGIVAALPPPSAQADSPATTRVSVDSAGAQGNGDSYVPSISADGRYVAFQSYATNLVTGATNDWFDIFVHDRQTGTTARVSVDSAGAQSDGDGHAPSISADGRFVAF